MRTPFASSLVLFALSGCPEPAEEAPRAEGHTSASPPTGAPAIAPTTRSTADAITIPAGIVRAGSRPGSAGRDPAIEADEVPIEIGEFRIDRSPYPDRAGLPPRTSVSRSEAAALCESEGERLCTELEWERACEGGAIDVTAGLAEWTASTADPRFGSSAGLAVVRGVGGEMSADRCAARAARSPEAREGSVAFRCCAGDPLEVAYPGEPARRTFREIDVPVEALRAALARVPELRRFAAGFEPFAEDDVTAVFTRGGVEPVLPEGVRRAQKVVEWAPSAGELAWIIIGRSGGASMVAVLYPLPDGDFGHAASMILEGDPLSVLLTYLPRNAGSLAWTTCFGCAGEGGEIQYRDDGRIVVVQL